MQKRIKIEKTDKDEKETFIHIYNCDNSVTICTTDPKIYNRLYKVLGEATQIFSPVDSKNQDDDFCYISGASWTFNYFKERVKLKKIFSMTNILPRNKQ